MIVNGTIKYLKKSLEIEETEKELEEKIAEIELIPGEKGADGKDARNPMTVSKEEPANPEIGDLWYCPD